MLISIALTWCSSKALKCFLSTKFIQLKVPGVKLAKVRRSIYRRSVLSDVTYKLDFTRFYEVSQRFPFVASQTLPRRWSL